MQQFEYAGIWWLPEKHELQVSGTLYFNYKEGARLSLIGSFVELQKLDALLSTKIILGLTQDGKQITLYRCHEKNRNINFFGLINSEFSVDVVFIGCHFEKEEDILFEKLSISYTNLDEWVGISGFQFDTKVDQKGYLKRFVVVYTPPQKFGAKIQNYNINISFDFNYKIDSRFIIQLKQITVIEIETKSPVHFTNYMETIVEYIRGFLSLAIGESVYPIKIIGKSKASVTKLKDERVVLNNIFIFYKLGRFADFSKRVYAHDMLFTYRDISDKLELYLENWISKSEILRPVYELYFSTLYNPSMYLNLQFLSLIQALEAYHRRIYGGKYISDEDYTRMYKAFIKVIPKNIDPGFRNSLFEKIKYLNELSLRRRLKDLFKKYKNVVKPVIPDKKKFIDSIKNTRDFLTHYDKNLESKSKKGKELYRLTQKIKFLLEICFLSELGMSDEIIRNLIKRNERYRRLSRQR